MTTAGAIQAARRAAGNNAVWCDAVCRAHGGLGEFQPDLWLNRGVAPPYYSNAVTLTPDGIAVQTAAIAELAASRGAFSVKDSFAALDLRPLGFDVLFEATWLWRDGGAPLPVAGSPQEWTVITDAVGLAHWEAAWAGHHDGRPVDEAARLFRPSLLAEPGVVFMAGARDGRMVAVAVANETDGVVGLSNVLTLDDPASCWAGAVGLAAERFPGRPLVAYERGDDLEWSLWAGFRPVGALRVWARGA